MAMFVPSRNGFKFRAQFLIRRSGDFPGLRLRNLLFPLNFSRLSAGAGN